jgi:ankyrin repeat protein
MPYYQCPKCGGGDIYQGTELVSGSKGGGAIIGPENDMGFSPVVGVGGRTTTSEQTVVKCKSCDIILGQKDYYLTRAEGRVIERKRKIRKAKTWRILFVVLTAVLIVSAGRIVWDFFAPPKISIHAAAKDRNIKEVKKNLAFGADINAKSADGSTPLHSVASDGFMYLNKYYHWNTERYEVAELLVVKGADLDPKDDLGNTPLHQAAHGGLTRIARLLIDKRADLNVTNNLGDTPLHVAVSLNGDRHLTLYRKIVAEELVRAGADINIKNNAGKTPLDTCIETYESSYYVYSEFSDVLELLRSKTSSN